MNIKIDAKKAKLYLNKINRLFEGIEQDSGKMAAIEKDLMLSYVRSFYETFFEEAEIEKTEPKSVQPQKRVEPKVQQVQRQVERVKEQPVKQQPPVQEKTITPPVRPVAPPPPKREPVSPPPPKPTIKEEKKENTPIFSTPKPIIAKVEPTPPKKETVAPPKAKVEPISPVQPVQMPPKPQPKPTPPPVQPPAINFDEFDVLFEEDTTTVKDLQHKLSQSKVTNLRSAMGINERFLMQNELFGGNNNAFNDAIDRLNAFDNFIQAKAYIIKDLAPTYEWLEEKRIKRAKSFIRTVQRRYK